MVVKPKNFMIIANGRIFFVIDFQYTRAVIIIVDFQENNYVIFVHKIPNTTHQNRVVNKEISKNDDLDLQQNNEKLLWKSNHFVALILRKKSW